VAFTDQGIRLAKRVAKEHVFVASGGGNGALFLAPPISRVRDDDRADRSPSQEDPTRVFSLQFLDQDTAVSGSRALNADDRFSAVLL
jgi:hypothetical protein